MLWKMGKVLTLGDSAGLLWQKIPTQSVGGPHAGERCYCMIT